MTRGVNCVGLIYRIEPRGGGVVTCSIELCFELCRQLKG